MESQTLPYDGLLLIRNYGSGGDLYINDKLVKQDIESSETYAGAMYIDGVVLSPGDVLEIRNAVVDDVVGTQAELRYATMMDILFDLPDGVSPGSNFTPTNPRALPSSFVFGNFSPWGVVSLSDAPTGYRFAFLRVIGNHLYYPAGGYSLDEELPMLESVHYMNKYIYRGDEELYYSGSKSYVPICFRSTSSLDTYFAKVYGWGNTYMLGFQLEALRVPGVSYEFGFRNPVDVPAAYLWSARPYPSAGVSRLLAQ